MNQDLIVSPAGDAQQLLDDWAASLTLRVRANELTTSTRTIYLAGMRKFVEWMHASNTRQVTSDAIRTWKAELLEGDYQPSTVNTWLVGVKKFFDWSVTEGRLLQNPAQQVQTADRGDAGKRHVRQPLSDHEMVRVLDMARQAPARDRAILTLMAYTALRTVEVHRADLAHLRTETGKLVLAVQGKGRRSKDEIVVIDNPEAVEALYAWLAQRGDAPGPLFTSMSDRNKAGRLSLSAIRTIVKGMFKQAGVVDGSKTTHSLRHTAITNAIANHASVTSVREMARHKNVETTMIYFHERDRIANAAEGYIQYRRAGE